MAEPTLVQKLRELAVAVTAEQLQLSRSPEFPNVWGVVVEQELVGLPVVLVSFAEGDTSLYMGVESGFVGLGQFEPVRAAAQSLLGLCQEQYASAGPLLAYEPPEPGHVSFMFHGWDGRHRLLVDIGVPKAPSEQIRRLYMSSQDVITQIRILEEASVIRRFGTPVATSEAQ